jgi:glycosyltransferase involved in cell wall biosynthesis
LYVQPSHEEGFCLAFIDAAMVVPRVLGTRTGEMAGVVQGEPGGRVVQPMDIGALERETRELLGVNVSDVNLQERRTRLLDRYSWAKYLQAHVKAYQG